MRETYQGIGKAISVALMEHTVFLVVEVGKQLFNLSRCHPFTNKALLIFQHPSFLDNHVLWHYRVCFVHFMQLFWVFQVHFRDVALWTVCWMLTYDISLYTLYLHAAAYVSGWLIAEP